MGGCDVVGGLVYVPPNKKKDHCDMDKRFYFVFTT